MTPHIESVERYLLRIVPNLAREWEGATEDEIARIQALTPRPLPLFYVWFLRRMGRSMGPMAYPLCDFTVGRILAAHSETEEFPFEPDPDYLLIGYNNDERMPLHISYDLEARVRDDALVVEDFADGGGLTRCFETFAEMLVWGKCSKFRVGRSPQRCSGSFTDEAYEPFVCLDPVMEKLGFEQPVEMGDRCRVYEREDACMICSGSLDNPRTKYRFYDIGAPDEATVRSLLGSIARETRLLIKLKQWDPAPAAP